MHTETPATGYKDTNMQDFFLNQTSISTYLQNLLGFFNEMGDIKHSRLFSVERY